MKSNGFTRRVDTLCPRIGQGVGDGEPLVTPLVQSTSYCREGIGSGAVDSYSRVSNPTVRVLEKALGDLEEAPPAVSFSSGLAAETALFLALLRSGDHMVCSRAVYGGTTRLLQQIVAPFGVETSFVDTTRVGAVSAAVRRNTRLIFIETPANPTLEVTDIEATAAVAREFGAALAVDNTFMTGVLQQPLTWGADASVYSTTKWIDGHSAALGGAVVSRDEKLLERLRFIRKSTGGIQTPFNAWLTVQGLKTLPLRIRRQSETAQEVANWLVEQAGFPKGFTRGPVGISRKHALAIVNHGAARAADIVALKDEVQKKVIGEFGIQLVPEPVFVGFETGG